MPFRGDAPWALPASDSVDDGGGRPDGDAFACVDARVAMLLLELVYGGRYQLVCGGDGRSDARALWCSLELNSADTLNEAEEFSAIERSERLPH